MSATNLGAVALFLMVFGAVLFSNIDVTRPMIAAAAFLLVCTVIVTHAQDEFF